jgi:hypothetical protein
MKATYLLPILFLVALSFASATENPVIVNGHVYMEGTSNPAPDVEVTVTCPAGDGWTFNDMTDAQGYYAVEFTAEQCEVGDTVHICAGNEDNCVDAVVTQSTFWKNIVYRNLEIPEFTWVAGGIALVGAGLGFMLLRKKN